MARAKKLITDHKSGGPPLSSSWIKVFEDSLLAGSALVNIKVVFGVTQPDAQISVESPTSVVSEVFCYTFFLANSVSFEILWRTHVQFPGYVEPFPAHFLRWTMMKNAE